MTPLYQLIRMEKRHPGFEAGMKIERVSLYCQRCRRRIDWGNLACVALLAVVLAIWSLLAWRVTKAVAQILKARDAAQHKNP
jgi:hypothetical protein